MNEELQEQECNGITALDCCMKCGMLISSRWQIKYPGASLCEDCSPLPIYSYEDENLEAV